MPTATLEEYLEAIYRLSRSGSVRPSAVAEAMSVSAPTVTATLQRLSERGLVSRPGGAIELTEDGLREALSILRRHRLAERLLVDILGLPWDEVHEDACLLEHALSPRVQEALERVLDYPSACPHGHPIPDAELSVPERLQRRLSDSGPGERTTVVSVDGHGGAALSSAQALGLVPGVMLTVVGAGRTPGSIVIDIRGEVSEVSSEIAALVDVGGVVSGDCE